MDVLSGLRGNQRRVFCVNANYIFNFFFNPVRIRAGQVNFIDYRHYVQIMIQCKVHVCQSLRLHALRRIHNQNRPVTGCQTPGYFIIEIHMSRSIN